MSQTEETKRAISEVARKEREDLQRNGRGDVSQERQERIVRESFERHEKKQDQRKRR